MAAKVYVCCNQKGGTGKSTTCVNLGIGLARQGKKVLLVDVDPQGSLTVCLGYKHPEKIDVTITSNLIKIIEDTPLVHGEGILHQSEGVDLMPANIELSGLEVTLVNIMSRESILKEYIDTLRDDYDFIVLDCSPSLGMLTLNALAAGDEVLIPVQAQYLPVVGMELLFKTIAKIKRKINPELSIAGVLITMADMRTTFSKDIVELINTAYGKELRIFQQIIPYSVRAAETSAEGKSIYLHDPHGKVAKAYEALTQEILAS